MVNPSTGNDNSGMGSKLRSLLGQRIRGIRKQRGLSQEQFAELAGRSVKTISNIEGGRAGAPIETLYRISEMLGVELKDLFDGVTLKRINRARAELLLRLVDTAHQLDDDHLRIAVHQLEALVRPKRQ